MEQENKYVGYEYVTVLVEKDMELRKHMNLPNKIS